MFFFIIYTRIDAQRWKDENRGLYPQSIQLNVNVRNTALGIRYGYLFQKPVLSMPIGVYGTFSNTIHPNPKYVNYAWERKYSLGFSITSSNAFKSGGTHFMGTMALVYNSHPTANQDLDNFVGEYTGGYYTTTDFGLDIGIMMQKRHFVGHIKADMMNWMKYIEFGAGFSFYRLRK